MFVKDVTVREDELFLMKILKVGNLKISYLPKAFYHYVHNPSSITNNPSPQTIHSVKTILAYITGEDGIHDENVYYSIKGTLLMDLFLTRRFAELPTTCPEMHARYIREHRRFHVFAPLASSLALALRGWPRLAYGLCHLCLWLVRVKEAVYH